MCVQMFLATMTNCLPEKTTLKPADLAAHLQA